MGGIHIHMVDPPVETAKVQPTVSTPLVAGADVEKGLVHPVTKGRVTILTLEMLVKDEAFEIRLTADEISDTSKGNGISKLIFILISKPKHQQCVRSKEGSGERKMAFGKTPRNRTWAWSFYCSIRM